MSLGTGIQQYIEPWLKPLRGWYGGLETREQYALKALAAMLLLFMVYWLVWQPVFQARGQARAHYLTNTDTLHWLQDNAAAVQQLRQQASVSHGGSGDDLASTVNATAGREGLTLKGFTPEGNSKVRIQMEAQPFTAVMVWLQALASRQGVTVTAMEVTPADTPGSVNIRATLQRG